MDEGTPAVKYALAITIMGLICINDVSAEEIKLQCGSATDSVILTIDTNLLKVHVGDDPDDGWYTNGAVTYQDMRDSNLFTGRQMGPTCKMKGIDFVRITADYIIYGQTTTNLNTCGSLNQAPGQSVFGGTRKFTIDRRSGILNAPDTFGISSKNYPCEAFMGNKF